MSLSRNSPVRPPLSAMVLAQLELPLVQEYIAQFSPMEHVAFGVAKAKLPMLNIVKSNGYRRWLKNRPAAVEDEVEDEVEADNVGGEASDFK